LGAESWFGQVVPGMVDGRPRTSGPTLDIHSPHDPGVTLCTIHESTQADVDDAVRGARAAAPGWAATPWQERVALLRRAADLISERSNELGALMSAEVGKNRLEALGDVEETADLIRWSCDMVEQNHGFDYVMGNLGEHYALGVYLGAEGLATYLQIQSGVFEPPDISALLIQKCLMASYEDREFLEQPDRALIKELGLKFRGRNAWPLFRSYRPGYHPWFVTNTEARFLTIALVQAVDVALRLKHDPQLLTPPRKGHYLVRVSEQRADGLHWSDHGTDLG